MNLEVIKNAKFLVNLIAKQSVKCLHAFLTKSFYYVLTSYSVSVKSWNKNAELFGYMFRQVYTWKQ